MWGPEGPHRSACVGSHGQVATLGATRPLARLVLHATPADSVLANHMHHPVADVAERLAAVVVGKEATPSYSAVRTLLLALGLTPDEVVRAGNAHTNRQLIFRHF